MELSLLSTMMKTICINICNNNEETEFTHFIPRFLVMNCRPWETSLLIKKQLVDIN